MEIRKATLNDSKAIAEVLVKSWRHTYQGIMPSEILENLSVKKRSEGWGNHLKNGGEAYVLINDGKVIGVIEISQSREEIKKYSQYAEIPVFYLMHDNTGQGLGYKLMSFAIKLLNERNINNIAIWVLEKNHTAINFYKKVGFINSGEIKEHPPTGLIEHLYIKNT